MANIGTTTAFYKVETSLTRANNEVSKSMERLATGRQNATQVIDLMSQWQILLDWTCWNKSRDKGASVVMGYLETGMRVLDAASALLSNYKSLRFLVRTKPTRPLMLMR